MSYKDILTPVKQRLSVDNKWWTNYLFHFTDINNAVNIIKNNMIYPRNYVNSNHLAKNDNASIDVINNTDDYKKDYARLYFRPLTPTQYHNEGYIPPKARGNISANCPVPVFFLLNLEKTLSYEGTEFAEKGLAGHIKNNIMSGKDNFANLKFDKIYHTGSYDIINNPEIKNYRQSEVIRKGGFPLKDLIEGMICRSIAEKDTLLFLLKKELPEEEYTFWLDKIRCFQKRKCFYNNGIFITNTNISNDNIYFLLNDRYKRRAVNKDKNITLIVTCTVTNYKDKTEEVYNLEIDYKTKEQLTLILGNCFYGDVKIEFDNCLMYHNIVNTSSELI